MKNAWLNIELSDYENHMALPNVMQAQYLSGFFAELLDLYTPKTAAIIGCAGGNGLERINPDKVEKIICVDINPNFIEEAEKRFKNKFSSIEFICKDIAGPNLQLGKADLVYCGLVFEYVDIAIAVKNIKAILNSGGVLGVILQMPNETIQEVTPSEYKSLEQLSPLFHFVPAEKLIAICESEGLKLISRTETELATGKKFVELVLRNNL